MSKEMKPMQPMRLQRQREASKRSYYKHREKNLQRKRKYYALNKEKVAEYHRQHMKKPSIIEKKRKHEREYRKRRPEILRAIDKKRSQKQERIKQKRESNRKRKLKRKGIIEDFNKKDWEKRVNETNGFCPYCNKRYDAVYPYTVTIDHSPPISKVEKGFHYSINMVSPMCGSCNSSKGDR
jgi:hypothetical protein